MKRYLKQAVQVVVLTVVLVFGSLLVLNSGVTMRDVEAGMHRTVVTHIPIHDLDCDDVGYHMENDYIAQ